MTTLVLENRTYFYELQISFWFVFLSIDLPPILNIWIYVADLAFHYSTLPSEERICSSPRSSLSQRDLTCQTCINSLKLLHFHVIVLLDISTILQRPLRSKFINFLPRSFEFSITTILTYLVQMFLLHSIFSELLICTSCLFIYPIVVPSWLILSCVQPSSIYTGIYMFVSNASRNASLSRHFRCDPYHYKIKKLSCNS